MKRILYDISRWHLFLHRDARGLAAAAPDDEPQRMLEDELFERLYSGGGEAVPDESLPHPKRDWASRVHEACEALPAFWRLASDCRGDEVASAAAVAALLDEVDARLPESETPTGTVLRRSLSRACAAASGMVSELRDALEGLASVRTSGSESPADRPPEDGGTARALARRLRSDPRLLEIAKLAGRFKRILGGKRRQAVTDGASEVAAVEQGNDLARLLPVELARMAHPGLRLAFYRDLLERQCLQYALAGQESLGKGPMVVCLDKSDSMAGGRDTFAIAVALALHDIARAEGRAFAMVSFNGDIKHEVILDPRERLPEEALLVRCSGGTDITRAASRALDIIERTASVNRADIVLITDGESGTEHAHLIRQRARRMNVEILGIGIAVEPEALSPWCEDARLVRSLSSLDAAVAEGLGNL